MPSCGGVIFGRGARMNIKETTLKYHNRNLYNKLSVANRKELLELHKQLQAVKARLDAAEPPAE